MAHHSSNPYSNDQKTSNAIDRKREKERYHMMQQAFKNADELSTRLVQRLLDTKIIETTAENTIREVFSKILRRMPEMEEFDINFKIAPVRSLVPNPNVISLYLTVYITEDLVNHPKIQDIFGDDLEIYQAVDSVLKALQTQ